MAAKIKLSQLVGIIEDAIQNNFGGQTFWITAEITDVKKQPANRWCFLKFIEKSGNQINTEIKGVFWSNSYTSIEKFEQLTGQTFGNGIEITCNVKVRFHKRYGLDLEVLDIDLSFALGKLELEKQQTLTRLLKENPKTIQQSDGQYITSNNRLRLPTVFQKVALITAPNSDGQRDFIEEIKNNKFGYCVMVTEYLTQIQGEQAALLILDKLIEISKQIENFDAVVIVRGGGSITDFKPFDDYNLAKAVAGFPIPILTGIGHDRNTSIVDLMARQFKTPTKVAAYIVEQNFNFEVEINALKERLLAGVKSIMDTANRNLAQIKRTVKAYSPSTILKKGYAIITVDDKIITRPEEIKINSELKTTLRDKVIQSTVTKIIQNGLDI